MRYLLAFFIICLPSIASAYTWSECTLRSSAGGYRNAYNATTWIQMSGNVYTRTQIGGNSYIYVGAGTCDPVVMTPCDGLITPACSGWSPGTAPANGIQSSPCAPSCSDGIKNQDETTIDCGGVCGPCEPATCQNGSKDGDEVGTDCGGSCIASCVESCKAGDELTTLVTPSGGGNICLGSKPPDMFGNCPFGTVKDGNSCTYEYPPIQSAPTATPDPSTVPSTPAGFQSGGVTGTTTTSSGSSWSDPSGGPSAPLPGAPVTTTTRTTDTTDNGNGTYTVTNNYTTTSTFVVNVDADGNSSTPPVEQPITTQETTTETTTYDAASNQPVGPTVSTTTQTGDRASNIPNDAVMGSDGTSTQTTTISGSDSSGRSEIATTVTIYDNATGRVISTETTTEETLPPEENPENYEWDGTIEQPAASTGDLPSGTMPTEDSLGGFFDSILNSPINTMIEGSGLDTSATVCSLTETVFSTPVTIDFCNADVSDKFEALGIILLSITYLVALFLVFA